MSWQDQALPGLEGTPAPARKAPPVKDVKWGPHSGGMCQECSELWVERGGGRVRWATLRRDTPNGFRVYCGPCGQDKKVQDQREGKWQPR